MSDKQEPNVDIVKDIKYITKLLYCLIVIFTIFIYSIWYKILL